MKKFYDKIISHINKIGIINRSAIWHSAQKFPGRLVRIFTIYKKDKINAIKYYLKNDSDEKKIQKEINNFKNKKYYNFNGIKLPLYTINADSFLNVIKPNINNIKYEPADIQAFYKNQRNKYSTLVYWKDNCQNKNIDFYRHIVTHGFTYFFKEIMVKKDDVIIDLGAAPGDFSAVCIQKGASKVYAFEPNKDEILNLEKVNQLNGNKIEIVKKYCADKTDQETNSISLDDFTKINNLIKIDFIKADIEGSEIRVLQGAKNILGRFKPKIAFCTYHTVNNELEIEKIILEANPAYKIYKQKGIIYAF